MEQRFQTPTPKLIPVDTSQGRIVTTLAKYVPAEYDGTNRSGYEPVGGRVIVLPDVAEGTTAGGIHIPLEVQQKNGIAAETGFLVAVSEGAFAWSPDRVRPWVGRKPVVGDRVALERYSGELRRGLDGQLYRICEDRAIGAIAPTLDEVEKSQ